MCRTLFACPNFAARACRVVRNLTLLMLTALAVQFAYASEDTDGDSMPDAWEIEHGFDPLIAHLANADADNDGLSDIQEYFHNTHPHNQDTEGDSLFDGWEVLHGFNPLVEHILNADADNDGLPDIQEFIEATHPHLGDTEGDLLNDLWEILNHLDPLDPLDAIRDRDGDGLNNLEEYLLGSDPNDPDSDDDGLGDFDEHLVGSNLNDPDSDDDGLNDLAEYQAGTDLLNADTDGDLLLDPWELENSFDPLVADSASSDVDADGLVELDEQAVGTNPRSSDSDGDSLLDGWEYSNGFDPLVANVVGADTDADGLVDVEEQQNGTNPRSADTDADGLLDSWEVANAFNPLVAQAPGSDHDNDSLSDLQEQELGTDPRSSDSDSDQLLDGWEVTYGLNPLVADNSGADPDADNLSNLNEQQVGTDPLSNDSDQDGLLDGWELTYGFDPLLANDPLADSDGDGLSDGEEQQLLTNPQSQDTDGDSLVDGWETEHGFDPLVANDPSADADADGLSNLDEQSLASNPNSSDTDADGLLDAWEVQYGFDLLVANPAGADTDGDGLSDLEEQGFGSDPLVVDTDMDGLGDHDEQQLGSDPTSVDTENDQLSDLEETQIGTDIIDPDTDDDTLIDGWEVANGFDPLVTNDPSADTDADGLTDFEEQQNSTNPNSGDTDSDALPDQWEVNNGTDPLADDAHADADGDLYDNTWEYENGTNPTENEFDDRPIQLLATYTHGDSAANAASTIQLESPSGVVIHPSGRYAIVSVANGFSVFSRDIETGVLDYSSHVSLPYTHRVSQFSNDGSSLYVLNTDAALSGSEYHQLIHYAFVDGQITEQSRIDFYKSTSVEPWMYFKSEGARYLAMSPDNLHLYIGTNRAGVIVFERDQNTGELGFVQQFRAYDVEMRVTSDLYVTSDGTQVVAGSNSRVFVMDRDVVTGMISLNQDYSVSALKRVLPGVGANDGLRLSSVLTQVDQNEATLASQSVLGALWGDVNTERNLVYVKTDFYGAAFTAYVNNEEGFSVLQSLNVSSASWVSSLSAITVSDDGRYIYGVTSSDQLIQLSAGYKGIGRPDADSDGVEDILDDFPNDPSATDDFDGDGLPDAYAATCDLDCQAVSVLVVDTDDDNDGVEDALDAYVLDPSASLDFDGDGLPDSFNATCDTTCRNASTLSEDDDDDNDGYLDVVDAFPLNASEWADFDGDGLGDNGDLDDDNDNMPDLWEVANGLNALDSSDALLDPDADTLTNVEEYLHGSDPYLADTDGDGVTDDVDQVPQDPTEISDVDNDGIGDNKDQDDDNDGLNDDWELANGFDPLVPNLAGADTDSDGLTDLEEQQFGTDPRNPDSDNDGMPDVWEVQYAGMDPWSDDTLLDLDGDLYTNLWEYQNGTDPSENEFDDRPIELLATYSHGDVAQNVVGDLQLESPSDVVVHPSGNYAVVAEATGFSIFQRDVASGELSYLEHIALDYTHRAVAFSNDGSSLYVLNTDSSLSGSEYHQLIHYSFDQGLVAQYSMTNFSKSSSAEPWMHYQSEGPRYLTMSPDNRHLYIGTNRAGVIVFERDQNTGELSFVQQFQAFDLEMRITSDLYVSHDGTLVVAGTSGRVFVMDRDAATGTISLNNHYSVSYLKKVLRGVGESDGLRVSSVLTQVDQSEQTLASQSILGAVWGGVNPARGLVYVKTEFFGSAFTAYVNNQQGFSVLEGINQNMAGWVAGLTGVSVSPDGAYMYGITSSDQIILLSAGYKGIGRPDADNDGVEDILDEFPNDPSATDDFDSDGLPDDYAASCNATCQSTSSLVVDTDDDNDGIDDAVDAYVLDASASADCDGDGLPDQFNASCDAACRNASLLVEDTDDDNDGYSDVVDAFPLNPSEWTDFDADGQGDNGDLDDDNDGMPDLWEVANSLNEFDSSDAALDPDADTLTNLEEFLHGSDPFLADTDGDGVADATDQVPQDPNEVSDVDGDGIGDNSDLDDDNDGLSDVWEVANGFDPLAANAIGADTDNDGLTDLEEQQYGTDPRNSDSDSDGMPDVWEVQYAGMDPWSDDTLLDLDGDTYSNLWEYQNGTDPSENEFDDRPIELLATYSHGEIAQNVAGTLQLDSPADVVIHPSGDYAVVPEATGFSIFQRDSETGALDYLEHVALTYTHRAVAFSKDGASLYVVNTDDSLAGNEYHQLIHYSFDDGLVAQYSMLNFSKSSSAEPWMHYQSEGTRYLTISPDDRHLYIGTNRAGVIVFERDQISGELSFVQQFRAYDLEMRITSDLYVSNDGSQVVAGSSTRVFVMDRDSVSGEITLNNDYSVSSLNSVLRGVDASDGFRVSSTLTQVDGSESPLASQSVLGAQWADVNPDRDLVYLKSSYFGNAFTAYVVRAGTIEVLERLEEAAASWVTNLDRITISPDGKHLYGVTTANEVIQLSAGYKGINP